MPGTRPSMTRICEAGSQPQLRFDGCDLIVFYAEIGRDHLGIVTDGLRRAFGDLDAVIHHHDVVGNLHHHRHVVLYQQDRDAVIGADREQQFAQCGALARIQSGGGLIEAQQCGLGAHRARDFETALIAVRQVAGGIVGAIEQADAVEPERCLIDRALLGGTPGRRADQPEKSQAGGQHQRIVLRDHQVFQRGHAGKQPDVLEGARDFRLLGNPEIVQPLEPDFLTAIMGQPHGAAGRLVKTGDAVEYGGLAGAVWSDQRGDLAALDTQNQIAAHPCPSLTRSDEIAWLCLRKTVGARWPISPRGRQIINSTIARPNTSMRYWSRPRNNSKPPIKVSAASATPSCEPMPPSTTIASTSADSWKVKDSGLMKPCRVAKKAPAKPPNMAPVANAVSLVVVVLMPSARQATSSSRNASQARPIGRRRSRIVTQLVSSASARIR